MDFSLIISGASLTISVVAIYFSVKSLNNDKGTKDLVDQMAAALRKKYLF